MPSHKQEKRPKTGLLLEIIIVILLLHLFLVFTKCTTIKQKETVEEISKKVNITESVERCYQQEFLWDYGWGEWSAPNSEVATVKFTITNLEDREGTFIVNFAFFDESLYPFDDYRGIRYEDVREDLRWDMASMHLDNITKTLKPKEAVPLHASVKKEDPGKSYWVYADVIAPNYTRCEVDVNTTALNANKTIKRPMTENVTETKTLLQISISKLF